jgi:thiosulfate dehydrogenase [quinone] large subunit
LWCNDIADKKRTVRHQEDVMTTTQQTRTTTPRGATSPLEHVTVVPTAGARALAVLRISTGFVFLWAFLDKLFGFGYATGSAKAWINGGSPTKGFLSRVEVGPFESFFHSIAGATWANWLFMLGLAGIGIALILGVGLRIAAIGGSIMMLMMWAAEWPLAKFTSAGEPTMSTNPFMDYHIIYALVLIAVAFAANGRVFGLGDKWAQLTGNRRFLQ